MSLTTMAADLAVAASSLRRGAPIGSLKARLISACSSAFLWAGGTRSSPEVPPDRTTSSRLASGNSNGSTPSPYGIESFSVVMADSPSVETGDGGLQRLDNRHRLAAEELDHGTTLRADVVELVRQAEPVHGRDAVAAAERAERGGPRHCIPDRPRAVFGLRPFEDAGRAVDEHRA